MNTVRNNDAHSSFEVYKKKKTFFIASQQIIVNECYGLKQYQKFCGITHFLISPPRSECLHTLFNNFSRYCAREHSHRYHELCNCIFLFLFTLKAVAYKLLVGSLSFFSIRFFSSFSLHKCFMDN